MPKLRVPPEEKESHAIVSLIKYGMLLNDISPERLALIIQKNIATVYRRFNCPEDFTLFELRAISSKLHIPLEKLVKGEVA